jgi:hypothetical protein
MYAVLIFLFVFSVPMLGSAQTASASDLLAPQPTVTETCSPSRSLLPPPSGLLALSFPRSVYETLKDAQRLLTDQGVITKDLHWWVDLTGPWEEFQWVIGVTLVYAPDSYFRVYYDKRDFCIRFVAFYKL